MSRTKLLSVVHNGTVELYKDWYHYVLTLRKVGSQLVQLGAFVARLQEMSINQSITCLLPNPSGVDRLATRYIFPVVLFVVCSSVKVKILCSSSPYLNIHVYCKADMFPLVGSFLAVRGMDTEYKLTPF